MKIDRLETHDRLLHFQKQSFEIPECIDNLIKSKPFGDHPFYIFCHPRTDDDGVTKRYIYQPRITKPKAQTNSDLYKVYPGTDIIKIIWRIPPREMWDVYKHGNMFENPIIVRCCHLFDQDRDALQRPEDDDPTPEMAQQILFEYQPQLFRRETLPEKMQAIWDRKMTERRRKIDEASKRTID